MIKKLEQRIFLIIMISLSSVVLGTIILFTFFNYQNTINTATTMMERFADDEIRKSEGPETNKVPQDLKIEGLYTIIVENSKIIENTDTSNNPIIEQNAIKATKEKSEKGIVGNYIYKKRQIRGNTVNIILMENGSTISHIKIIMVFSIILSLVSLIIIYIIAKKLSKMIVKPVHETFEKQKQFISDVSHELKTPLAVIEANADVLENEIGNNKWMEYIQNEIESMDKLINELLLLAKIENIDNIKEFQKLNLSKETEIIISMFESMAYEKGVKIDSKIQENVEINGNKEDMEHILSTLIDNAIKHTPPEKEVKVELNKEKNEIVIQVKNMGEAIPDEEKEKIFERFYRIDKSRNRQEKRYGLGLAIAKSTVEKYKGKIEVSHKDGFTIFKVIMPI